MFGLQGWRDPAYTTLDDAFNKRATAFLQGK